MTYVYVGTFGSFTANPSEGVYCFSCDDDTGELRQLQVVPLQDPSFITVAPERGMVYAATHSATFEGETGAGAVALRIDPDSGRLERLNSELVPSPHPAYISVDRTERFALIACGLGGGAVVLPIADDGSLLPVSDLYQFDGDPSVPLGEVVQLPAQIRAGAPHPHCVKPDPANRYVLVSNLGHNRLHVFEFDAAEGRLHPHGSVASPPGVESVKPIGARHFDFHPDGGTLYVNNERHSSVTVFAYDPETGTLTAVETVSTLPPEGFEGNASADIHVHPSGRFLYVSNRGHDSVAIFAIDPATQRLEPRGHAATGGRAPRNFALSPDGRLALVANQASSTIAAFRVGDDGSLEPTGRVAEVPAPTCIAFY